MSAPNDPLAPPPPPRPPPTPPVSYAPPPTYVAPPAPPKKKKTWLIVLAAVGSLALLFIIGCSVLVYGFYSFGKSHQAATTDGALVTLHDHMTKAEDAAIYDETDPLYKLNTTAQQSNAVFDQVRSVLGNPTNAQVMDTKTRTVDGAEVVNLHVLTTFTKGSADELIEFRKVSDGMYRMTEYGIQSTR